MKRCLLIILSLLIFGCLPALATTLCDYRSPETSLTELEMTLNYRYFDDGATPNIDVNSGRIEINGSQFYDSPSWGSTMTGLARMSLSSYVPTDLLSQGSGTLRFYLDEALPWYAFGGLEGSASLAAIGLDLRAGTGYGRFTDVTPMSKAVHIERSLLELGVVDVPLTDELLMTVAQTIGRSVEFETIEDIVQSLENAIEAETGASLGTKALLSIEDILKQTQDIRKCGWSVQGGLGYEVIDPENGKHDLLLAFSTDIAWVIATMDQLILHANVSGPLKLDKQSTVNVSGDYDRQMSEDTTMELQFAWQRIDPMVGAITSTWSASAALSYALDLGNIVFQASIGKEPQDARLTTEISISASVDLL